MTFSNLMKKWLEDNKLSSNVGNDRFGKVTFWQWINDKRIPHETRIPEISDKTGLSIKEITDAIKESKKQKKDNKQPAKPSHFMDELAKEADAVRKLKAGLETIVKPEPITAQVVHSPLELPLDDAEFDKLVMSYAEAYKQRCDVENDMKALQKKLDEINSSLMTIKNKIRSVA